jgi:pyruvate dehydrogenase E1 component
VRRHFLVDAESITVGALAVLARRGEVDTSAVIDATRRYHLGNPAAAGPQTSDPGDA